MRNRHQLIAIFAVLAGTSACTGESPPGVPYVPGVPDPGVVVAGLSPPAAFDALSDEADRARATSPDELRAAHTNAYGTDLGYDPLAAEGLELILPHLALDDAQTARVETELAENGFTIAMGQRFPSFAYGYSEIYRNDLPVYVTADMVLEAVYRSHREILRELEHSILAPSLGRLLTNARAELVRQQDTLSPETASNLDVYLGVALALLNGSVDSHDSAAIVDLVEAAEAAEGIERRVLFGVEREIDFSQFTVRGHYTVSEELGRYFRAMMWLGRIDFRLLETTPDGRQVVRRAQVEAALALRSFVMAVAATEYAAIDATITALVGEHDYLTLDDLETLMDSLGTDSSLDGVSDEDLGAALVGGGFRPQRIVSHVMRRAPGSDAYPLNASFALLGQRYAVDSHVLSNATYSSVPTRVVPDALDVGFSALRNDQALALLGDEVDEQVGLAGALASMRVILDSHEEDYWRSSLYTSWFGALRELSPPDGGPASDLPAVARTDAWGRRLLNTQLASWAQLRHNNVLYVRQSYTEVAACEYPDAYVDPYPEFFRAIARYAARGQELAARLDPEEGLDAYIERYFVDLASSSTTLAEMAEHQLTGTPHSEAHLAFINRAVTIETVGCTGTELAHTGWYADMHYYPRKAVEQDPSITDVHTDVGGALPVVRDPSVLHVGTHLPRPIVVTVETCSGPKAYVGVVSLFQQRLVPGLTRLTDEAWDSEISNAEYTPEWLSPALAR